MPLFEVSRALQTDDGKLIPQAGKAIPLGGFTDTKRTGFADWSALWDGWNSLQMRLEGYLAAKKMLADGMLKI